MAAEKAKRKQGPKKGRVIRVSPDAWKIVEKSRKSEERIVMTVDRLILGGLKKGKRYFILPDSGIVLTNCRSLAEARGAAVLHSVRKFGRGKVKEAEEPIAVFETWEAV